MDDRPKPLAADRRWPIWIQFLLGTAGIAVTAAGLYELGRSKPAAPPPASAAIAITTTQAQQLEAREVERQTELAEIRAKRNAAEARLDDLKARGARCMDGVWIIKEDGEVRSAGSCR